LLTQTQRLNDEGQGDEADEYCIEFAKAAEDAVKTFEPAKQPLYLTHCAACTFAHRIARDQAD
jgi:hypothetical protein